MKLLLSVLLALAAAPAWPQSQYSEDLTECFTAFKSLIARAENISTGNKAGKLGIQAEVVQLQVKLSKLSRETAQANLALARSGPEPIAK